MTTNTLSPLESSVLNKLLEREDPKFQLLRQQLVSTFVAERVLTGVGFRTLLQTEQPDLAMEGAPSMQLSDVAAEIDGLEHGAGFVLFIERGLLHQLEGFSYDEPWPRSISSFRVYEVTRARGRPA